MISLSSLYALQFPNVLNITISIFKTIKYQEEKQKGFKKDHNEECYKWRDHEIGNIFHQGLEYADNGNTVYGNKCLSTWNIYLDSL